jgi:hypothetical protein
MVVFWWAGRGGAEGSIRPVAGTRGKKNTPWDAWNLENKACALAWSLKPPRPW